MRETRKTKAGNQRAKAGPVRGGSAQNTRRQASSGGARRKVGFDILRE